MLGLVLAVVVAASGPSSVVDRLLDLAPEERVWVIRQLSPQEQQDLYLSLRFDWRRWARPEQLPPDDLGLWDLWILLAGRGGGKTRVGSELCNRWAQTAAEYADGQMGRIALVARDAKSCRDVMVKGDSGIEAFAPPWCPADYEPSKALVTWKPKNAPWTVAEMHSAEEPKTLRGPQFHKGWGDEFPAWRRPGPGLPPEAWADGLEQGVRLGRAPQTLLTSTPRGDEFVATLCLGPKIGGRRLVTPEQIASNPDGVGRWSFTLPNDEHPELVVVSRWSSERNKDNLAPGKIAKLRARYGGTRAGRQELDGEILEKVEGALWTTERLDANRASAAPELKRIEIAVDPTRAEDPTDECGIMVGGRDAENVGFLLADETVKGSPDEWARAAVGAYWKYSASAIVYENNRMGAKLQETIRTVDPKVKWVAVKATEDKLARAQPVSALGEQGRIKHVGLADVFDVLESELTGWDPHQRQSPNRLDAYVWLFTSLLIGIKEVPAVGPASLTKQSSWRS